MRRSSVIAIVSAALLGAGLVAPASAVGGSEPVRPADRTATHLSSVGRAPVRASVGQGLAAEREVIVRLAPRASAASVRSAAEAHGAKPARDIPRLRLTSFLVPVGSLSSVVAELRARSDVVAVETPAARRFLDTPSDPRYSAQSTYLDQVDAPAAWGITHGGATAPIAIVDSGVDLTHEDLAGKVVKHHNAVDGTADVSDAVGHGTLVATVAAATTSNGVGMAGAGWDTPLFAVKVADSTGAVYASAVANGIVWATDNGAKVVNLSLGSDVYSFAEQDAVTYAQQHDVVVVASAGNSGDAGDAVIYPAAYDGVISVGATDPATQKRAPWSQYGDWVSVGAPGVGIVGGCSTQVSATFGIYTPAECPVASPYLSVDGTSFASPIVAAEAALVRAVRPDATAVQVRHAVVSTGHGYAGEGIGTGIVDFSASFDAVPPLTKPTITAPSAAASVKDTVTISATSTAAKVQFYAGGSKVGAPVDVVAGSASTTWPSYGYTGGTEIWAADCTWLGDCASDKDVVGVTVANDAPVITSPASGASVSGAFTITAGAPGGVVQFRVDGVDRGTDGVAPYSLTLVNGLPDGPHTLVAMLCNAAASECQGPASAPVVITARSLHPVVTSLSPNPFSPNGDKKRDTATAVFRLPDVEVVTYVVTNVAGTVVFGPKRLGSLAAGTHPIVLTGRNNGGVRLANGVYTLRVNSTRSAPGVVLRGTSARAFTIDSTAPVLSGISGFNQTFYPVRDGFRDTWAMGVTLNEPATVAVVIRNKAGAVVRTLSAARPAGRVSLAWNGRSSSGALLPAGEYKWRITATDRAANVRTSVTMRVLTSWRKLVTRTAVVTATGASAYEAGVPASCAWFQASAFAGGIHYVNTCDPAFTGSGGPEAHYALTLPSAISYSSLTVGLYGSSAFQPSFVVAGFYDFAAGSWGTAHVTETGQWTGWYGLGSWAAAGRTSGRTVRLGVYIPNDYADVPPFDFDLGSIRVTVVYKVLG